MVSKYGKILPNMEKLITEFKVIPFSDIGNLIDRIQFPEFDSEINDYVIKMLEKTLIKYIPTYASSFANTESKMDASMYIGIADDGKSIGIPLQKEPSIDFIKSCINKCKKFTHAFDIYNEINYKFLDDYFNEITIEIIKLDKTLFEPYDFDKLLEKINEEDEIYASELVEYNKKVKDLRAYMDRYLCSLEELCNKKTKKEFWQFCKNGHNGNICPDDILKYIATNDRWIRFPKGVADVKSDPKRIEYWITEFKESRKPPITRIPRPIMKRKTRKEIIKCFIDTTRFAKHWKSVEYYVIKINFPTKNKVFEGHMKHVKTDQYGNILVNKDGSITYIKRERSYDIHNGPYCQII